jgi:hypothetical protein
MKTSLHNEVKKHYSAITVLSSSRERSQQRTEESPEQIQTANPRKLNRGKGLSRALSFYKIFTLSLIFGLPASAETVMLAPT